MDEKQRSSKNVWLAQLTAILVSLPATLWALGIHVGDLARVLFFISMAVFIYSSIKKTSLQSTVFSPHKKLGLFYVFLIGLVSVTLVTYLILRVFNGSHGIDFLIFTQVFSKISLDGTAMTSLLGGTWRNFIFHHFSPFLYVPGALAATGIPPWLAGVLIHVACLLGTLLFLFKLSQKYSFYWPVSVLFIFLFISNPTIRHGIFWSYHPEVFAMPFLAGAWYFWRCNNYKYSCAMLFIAMTTKESMFLWVFCFCIMTLLENLIVSKNKKDWNRWLVTFAPTTVVSLVGFILYFFLQPLFIDKGFDHFSKIGSTNILMSPQFIGEKIWLSIFIFLPVLFFPFYHRRGLIYLLPAVPLVGMIYVSGFPEMWKLMNYYSIVPTLTIYLASLEVFKLKFSNGETVKSILFFPLMIAISISFSFSGQKPMKIIRKGLFSTHLNLGVLALIPAGEAVAVNRSSGLFLLDGRRLVKISDARDSRLLPNYVVVKKNQENTLPKWLLRQTKQCLPRSKDWHVRCKISHALL